MVLDETAAGSGQAGGRAGGRRGVGWAEPQQPATGLAEAGRWAGGCIGLQGTASCRAMVVECIEYRIKTQDT